MKAKVLRLLKANFGEYISGQRMSQMLQVSRTAIWKAVSVLRAEGYVITSLPRRGYCLLALPDLLTPLEIGEDLTTAILGQQIYHAQQIDSTNSWARQLALANAAEGTLVVAESQNGGRGRLGRQWSSPQGGIWLSLILRPQLPVYQVQLMTLLTAVVVVETTKMVAGLAAGIKWPNDVLVNGKKLAGILTEISADMDCLRFLLVGVGINANVALSSLPVEIQQLATSIVAETKEPISRRAWVQHFLKLYEQEYLKVQRDGFADILQRWRQYALTLGQVVAVQSGERTISGKAVDINEQGALLIKTTDGIKTVWAGDVL